MSPEPINCSGALDMNLSNNIKGQFSSKFMTTSQVLLPLLL